MELLEKISEYQVLTLLVLVGLWIVLVILTSFQESQARKQEKLTKLVKEMSTDLVINNSDTNKMYHTLLDILVTNQRMQNSISSIESSWPNAETQNQTTESQQSQTLSQTDVSLTDSQVLSLESSINSINLKLCQLEEYITILLQNACEVSATLKSKEDEHTTESYSSQQGDTTHTASQHILSGTTISDINLEDLYYE